MTRHSTGGGVAIGRATQTRDRLSIVVDVPEGRTDNECFVAMPFAANFNNLWHTISDAALQAGLHARRTDIRPQTTDFVNDIIGSIRSARMFVAVLIPESEKSDSPNANVMYELGLAHALGTPAVIVVDGESKVPSDLVTMFRKKLQDGVGEQPNQDAIASAMQTILQRMVQEKCVVIDPAWNEHGISEVSAKRKPWLYNQMCSDYCMLLAFAEEVHHRFMLLHGDLSRLLGEAKRVLEKHTAFQKEKALECRGDFRRIKRNDYEDNHQYIDDNIVPELETRFGRADEAFKGIKKQLFEDEPAMRRVSDSERFYVAMKEKLQSYQGFRERFEKKCGGVVDPLADERGASDLSLLLAEFEEVTAGIVMQSQLMLRNLIEALE